MNDAQAYTGAAVIGAAAGIRSMSGPNVISQLSEAGLMPAEGSPMAWLQNPAVHKAINVLAGGEMLADKLPFLPARTDVGPMAARAITGGLSGAAVCAAVRRPWWIGALIGAAAAIGASFGATKLRKWITEDQHVPNSVAGLIEDAVVVGSTYLVMSSLKSQRQAIADA
jgi:uncharacterized membrane protein